MAAIIRTDESRGKYEWASEPSVIPTTASPADEPLATILSSPFHPTQLDSVLSRIDKLFDGTVLKAEWCAWFIKLARGSDTPETERIKFFQEVRFHDRLQSHLWCHAERWKFFIPLIQQLKCIIPTSRSISVDGEMREELEFLDPRYAALRVFCNEPEYCHQLLASICNPNRAETLDGLRRLRYPHPNPFDIVDMRIGQQFLKKWITDAAPYERNMMLDNLFNFGLSPKQIIFLFKECEPHLRAWSRYNDGESYPNLQSILIKLRFMLMDSNGCQESIARMGMAMAEEEEMTFRFLSILVRIIGLKEIALLASAFRSDSLTPKQSLQSMLRAFQALIVEGWPAESEENQAKLEELFVFCFSLHIRATTLWEYIKHLSISKENLLSLCRACIRAVIRVGDSLPLSNKNIDPWGQAIHLIGQLRLDRNQRMELLNQEPQFTLRIQHHLHILSLRCGSRLLLVRHANSHVAGVYQQMMNLTLPPVLNELILSYVGISSEMIKAAIQPNRIVRAIRRCQWLVYKIPHRFGLVFNAVLGCCKTKEKRRID